MLNPFSLDLKQYEALWQPVGPKEVRPGGDAPWRDDPSRQYIQKLISSWVDTQTNAEVVNNLLQMAVQERGDSSVEIACLMEAAQICQKHQMFVEARSICAACFTRRSRYAPPFEVRELYHKLVAQTQPAPSATPYSQSFNPLSPEDTHFVRCFLEDLGKSDWTEKVLDASQLVITARIKEAHEGKHVTSRLGGVPDVEEGWEWPERLEFLAQLNLEELAPYDLNDLLPKRGLLRFFMLNLAYEWEEDGFCVEFYDGDLANLQKAQSPNFLTDLREEDSLEFEDVIYKEAEFEFETEAQLDIYEVDFDNRDTLYETRKFVDSLANALEKEQHHRRDYQVLGTVTKYAFIPRPEEEKDWTLLFAIGSSEDKTGMMFSDVGTMYFYMKRDDLLARRFNRVQVTMTNG